MSEIINNPANEPEEQGQNNQEEEKPVGISWWNPDPSEQYYEHPIGNSN